METMEQKIKGILSNIVRDVEGVEGALLVDNNGFVLASSGLASTSDPDLIGGILSSLANVALRVGQELDAGDISGLIIEGGKKQVYMRKIGDYKTLIVIARKGTPMGMLTYIGRKSAPLIDEIL